MRSIKAALLAADPISIDPIPLVDVIPICVFPELETSTPVEAVASFATLLW